MARNKITSGWGTGRLNTKEAVEALGISRDTLFTWIAKGKIKPIEDLFNPNLALRPANFFREEDVKALMGPTQLEALERELAAQNQPEYIQPPLSNSAAA